MLKNITLSADEQLIEAARARARDENTTLNEQFRRWLATYARRGTQAQLAWDTIADLRKHIRTGGRTFSRDEMHER